MRLVPKLRWSIGPDSSEALDSSLLELLGRIESDGSLRAAAGAIGMPYRTAWGMLQDMAHAAGAPLVRLQRGRGATLTADGAALLRADESARRRLARQFDAMTFEIGTSPSGTRSDAVPVLRVAASHDLALAALQDALPSAAGVRLQIEFCGSFQALARYRAGQADIAGFHVVPGQPATAQQLLRHLSVSRDRLVRFVDREQGLIVARGNPHRVRCLVDVARRKLRFVNRQEGSGTRLLIDAQLHHEGLAGSELQGFASEEFTHAAVAATIASSRADAGFGVAAAAAEYDLGFVPMVRERYYFVVRDTLVRSAALVALRNALAGPVLKELVGQMVGYDATHAGRLERVAVRQGRGAQAAQSGSRSTSNSSKRDRSAS